MNRQIGELACRLFQLSQRALGIALFYGALAIAQFPFHNTLNLACGEGSVQIQPFHNDTYCY